ncbi:MAG: SAM-dependent methyltransferase [Sporocytophaga sp.]|nr:SAM-dependent methyltransferase [Sporocytophaga sp.]
MNFFKTDSKRAIEAITEAQKIAFAPVIFQAVRCLRELGILEYVSKKGQAGAKLENIATDLDLSVYGARVLLEAGLGIGVLYQKEDESYIITKVGHFILYDEITNVNFNFIQDVCYQGLNELKDSIKNGKPEGLKVFGNWPTIYEGLSKLPSKAKTSWFEFDHYYSDQAFDTVLPYIFKHKPAHIYDIGGNTGKFSLKCVKYDKDVRMTIIDLPGQLAMAQENIAKEGFSERIKGHHVNLLDASQSLPKGADAVWMSQFLDCFSEEEIISILKRCVDAIDDNGAIYILETYWDRQKYEASAFSLQMTSLYFTAMANGNSQMYHSKNLIQCVHAAGLYVEEDIDNIGVSHTLFRCKKRK